MKIPTLSTTHYAGLVGALTLGLFAAFGVLTYFEMQQVKNDAADANLAAAQRELNRNIERVFEQSAAAARQFAAWDEVRQQLRTPQYYAYWRGNRMPGVKVLPAELVDADIYDRQGMVLAITADNSLPATISQLLDAPFVSIEGDQVTLVLTAPVHARDGSDDPTGHIAIRLRLLPLLQQEKYRYIDGSTLRLAEQPQSLLTKQDLGPMIQFELRENLMSQRFESILSNAIVRLGVVVGLITLAVYLTLVYMIGQPLSALSNQIDRFRRDPHTPNFPARETLIPIQEIKNIHDSLAEYHDRLANVSIRLDKKDEEISRMAEHDALTGALNRHAFDNHWRDLSKVLGEHRFGVCLVLFDIIHFKALNDSYGHQAGDEVLKAVGSCIQSVLRRGEQLFRLGGDEFATLLINCDDQEVWQIAERCQRTLASYPFDSVGLKEPIRVSIGMAHTPSAAPNMLQLLHGQADIAMHYAKKPGRRNIAAYNQEMAADVESVFSNRINNAIFEAIVSGTGLAMHYQPVVDLRDNTTAYFEALLRINYRDERIVPANIFPVVEARRLETDLDRAVFKRVRQDIEAGRIPKGCGLSINVSGPTISNPGAIDWLSDLAPYLNRHRLILEITETALITQLGLATKTLQYLRDLGFQVALDDFGSGYSSIRYLASMPVDIVKFDISLIRLLNSPTQNNIVIHLAQMIIESGHSLVAEGIETVQLLRKVRDAGFSHGQGYLFGRPDAQPLSFSTATAADRPKLNKPGSGH